MKNMLFSLLLGAAAFGHSVAAADHDHDHDHPHVHVERWTSGHGDIGLGYEDGVLALHIQVDQGAVINGAALTEGQELEPEETRIIASEKTRKTGSASLASGTGVPEGQPLWELPGIQVSGVPFFGFAAEELDPSEWPSSLRFNLQQVVSPSGQGHFSVYSSDGLGGVSFLMSTSGGGITSEDYVPINAGGHDHFFMTFSEPGTWMVTLTGTGVHSSAGELTTEPVTFIFEVGEKPSRWTAGHGDIGVAYEEGELDLHLHLEEGAVLNGTTLVEGVEPPPSLVDIVISNAALVSSTETLEEGTGAHEGESLWILPASNNPQLPFLGFGTEELDPADWIGDITFTLVSVESPSGEGHFSAFESDGLGGYAFNISTHMGGVTAEDHLEQAAGAHSHQFLAFTETGRWRMTFIATATHAVDGAVTSQPITFVFDVGSSSWSEGHGDIGVAFHDDHLDLHLHLHEGAVLDGVELAEEEEPDPASTNILVSDAAQTIATEELHEGAGVEVGENLWILPSSNRAGLPFLGLGAEELNPEEWTGEIRLSLLGVDSPSGAGNFAVYQSDGLGGYTFAMSTAQGGITGDDHADMTAGGHDHYAFSFSEAGVWQVTFIATGTHNTAGVLTSEAVTYTFVVGGSQPGAISFGQDHYVADQGDGSINVNVVRSDASQHAEVTLTTTDGSVTTNPPFAGAIAGRDYVAPTGEDTHVHFEVGEFSKMVTLTLLPPTRPVAQNRHFIITLSDPEDGATLGERSTATVRILASDTRKPTLALSSPGTKVSAAVPMMVSGKAGDAFGLDRVEVIINDADPVLAELDGSAKTTSVPFTAWIQPVPGTNTLIVTAYDLSGNSTQITRTFTFETRYRVSLLRSVPETMNEDADEVGSLAIKALPSSAASALTPKDAQAALKTSDVLAGVPVTLTASAKKGYTFSHWTGLPNGAVEAGLTTSFTMPSEDVSVQAVFIENPFVVEADTAAGTGFQGLILPDEGTSNSNATTGYLTGTLNASTGAFSGQVIIDGLLIRFVATFNGDGRGFFKVGRSLLSVLTFGDCELSLEYVESPEGGHIAANLEHGEGSSSGLALRGLYGRASRTPEELLNSTSRGFYTLAMPAKAQTPVVAKNLFPQGTGFAMLTLDAYGSFRYSGTLADGTKVTGSSFLVAEDKASLFVQITTPGQSSKVKGGSLGGVLAFDPTQTNSDVSSTDLFWYRPAVMQVDRPTAAATATSLYTEGWPQGLALDAVGALYNSKVTVQTALDLLAEDTAQGNAELVLDDGKLSETTSYAMNIVGNSVKKLSSSDKSYALKLGASTGSFSGTFTPDWASSSKKAPTFQGIILQKGTNRGGYGFFISNAEGDRDPESGRAALGTWSAGGD